MNLTIILVLYILIIIFDFLPLLKKDNKKVLSFYIGASLLTLTILVLYSFDIVIPNPVKPIENIINNIF